MTDHWRLFTEFCRYEKAVGGPSAHLCMVAGMSKELPTDEQVWRAGCYGAFYNTGSAMALWSHLSRAEVLSMSEDELVDGINDCWEGFLFHRHRRAIRRQDKLARYLYEYAVLSRDWPDRDWWHSPSSPANYQQAWGDVLSVYGVGRYIAIRILELFSRFGAGTAMQDIRAQDADSPRRTLSLLWPSHARMLSADGSRAGIRAAESIANTTMHRMLEEYGVGVNHYELQVMTCEYHQSIDNGKQFPGKSIDGEAKALRSAEPYWGTTVTEPGWQVRKELFPEVSLGEVNGWTTRDELGRVARDYGYTWSDLRYDYRRTTDLARPVER